ncbi:MAG: hypothetical protein CI947_787 [Halanaerobium sp.]|nr:MAG: hypothetical protein CI947_787 [Halanaerobium sp.]
MIFILILITLITPQIEAEEITVSAEAEITGGVEIARREALQKAFLRAVHRITGSYIRQSTLLKNSELISQRIYSRAEGYVTNYQILKESAAEGVYKLQLKAEVSFSLISDLEELKLVIETQTSNPRILLLIDDAQPETLTREPGNQFQVEVDKIKRNLGAPAVVNRKAAEIQHNLRAGLKELGFKLAPENQFLNSLLNPAQWQQQAVELLRKSRQPFEILIIGKHNAARLGERDFGVGTLTIQGVTSSMSIYSAQTGEKLKEINFTEKAYARDAVRALAIAVEKMSRSGAERLAVELMPLINLNSGQKRLKLQVNNLASFEDLTALEGVIKKMGGIQSFKLQTFADNSASYLLKVIQSTAVLAERFQNEEDFPLEVLELGPDYLKLKAN